jgi:hypothetical protein
LWHHLHGIDSHAVLHGHHKLETRIHTVTLGRLGTVQYGSIIVLFIRSPILCLLKGRATLLISSSCYDFACSGVALVAHLQR